jgi:hypothetical protein
VTFMRWKYVYTSAQGTYHSKTGTPCQDACGCRVIYTVEGEPVLTAVASDGAGSANYSQIGSKLACSILLKEVKRFIESGNTVKDFTRTIAENILTKFQNKVLKCAESMGIKKSDFACTLLCTIVGERGAAFFQIGDGAMVISKCQETNCYSWVFWPGNDEYENITHFAVDPESSFINMEYIFIEDTIDEVAIFTDGIQRLALHYQSRTAYTPFFKPIFAYIRSSPYGCLYRLQNSLTSFLHSKKINDRTDDDKTLIIASRYYK